MTYRHYVIHTLSSGEATDTRERSFLRYVHNKDEHKDSERHLVQRLAEWWWQQRETYNKRDEGNHVNFPSTGVDFATKHSVLLPPKSVAPE